ncbi:hypothetical protein HPB52_001980 [Rhipicephalus sanguineus]|uniref:Amino acid transporter n=1 Tax=Rhipicephalus sanguineus TaxID=34632 RepID=A0A9D4SM34_RHISA|nr:hypothetical protein HPB52_001980 [Rhipicephalus sanguineus]
MASNKLGENTGASQAAEPGTEKQHSEQSTAHSEAKAAEATTPGSVKAGAAATESPAPMSSAVPADAEAEEGPQGRRRRLSSKVVVVAPRSDTALIPPRNERHRTRRLSSIERLHEASQQALATSGAERYLNLWLFIGVSNCPPCGAQLMYVAFPGDMLLRMLQLCVMPLITASIVAAIGGVDLRLAGRLGRRGFIYYMATTVIAEIEGLALVFLIRPGVNANVQLAKAPPKRVFYLADAIMDIARNMIPPNLVEATLYSWSTKVILPAPPEAGNFTGEEDLEPEFVVERSRGTNVLGLLVFAAFVGSIIAATGERNRAVHDLVVSITDIMMSLIRIVMYCPAGVGFLIAHRILATGNLGLVLSQLGLYVVTVLVGLAIHMFIVLSALYLVSATVPVTIATLEDRVGLDPRVVRFMVPVGATVNMDGAALYEAVSAVFLAQLHGVEMDIGRVLAVSYTKPTRSVTATVASVGAAGIPGGGLVTMVIVLQAVGLPAEDIGLIATVDWFLDRFRTVVNVIGDCVGAAIVHQLSQADLNVGVVNEDDNALSSAIRPKAFV